MKKPEILSPGGDADSVKAAVAAGADAVYLGLKKFNARKRAENISESELKDLISIAHSGNTEIYITMNVLLLQNELDEALNTALRLYNSGADGLIVQDPGFALLLKKHIPEMKIHASTQMTTHNSFQLDLLDYLNFSQVNFSRELSLAELGKVCRNAHERKIKTEVFVHGAYCVSCSGLCYFSSITAGESANRGACVQLCRRKYRLTRNGDSVYLLNLKDNSAYSFAEDLIKAGVDVFKIEGRIKNFFYVHSVTESWRNTADLISNNTSLADEVIPEKMRQVFNRNFSAGYLEDKISADMFNETPFDQSMKYCGKVISYTADKNALVTDFDALTAGSKISIFTPERNFVCTAEIIASAQGGSCQIRIENVLMGKILKGQDVFLTGEADEINAVRNRIDALKPVNKELKVKVSGKPGGKLKAVYYFQGSEISVESSSVLSAAQKNPLTREMLLNQLGRLGGSGFYLSDADVSDLQDNLFLPVKELNLMRRNAIDSLTASEKSVNFIINGRTGRTALKKPAVLFSDKNDFSALKNIFNGPAFLETTAVSTINDFTEGLNPWIPAFITDDEFHCYTDLLQRLKPEFTVCDNSGIASWCRNNSLKWISGPELNSCNGYTFQAYSDSGACGGFFSSEISSVQMNDFFIPEKFNVFCRIYSPQLMMTSRQCFFLNSGQCRMNKIQKDADCLVNCRNNSEFFDEHGRKFFIEKSRGYINRIYGSEMLFIPEAAIDLQCDYYLIDLRKFDFTVNDPDFEIRVLSFFNDVIINGKINNNEYEAVKKYLGKISKGCYYKGFDSSSE
ncbi:MAG: U32 family peptidase [Spirochaetes bacterium]|nr:U32 family peptidase [Spirochaetota bacterium]